MLHQGLRSIMQSLIKVTILINLIINYTNNLVLIQKLYKIMAIMIVIVKY
jgi:hypothetical protein